MLISSTRVIKADLSACGQSLARVEEKDQCHHITAIDQAMDGTLASMTTSRPLYHRATQLPMIRGNWHDITFFLSFLI